MKSPSEAATSSPARSRARSRARAPGAQASSPPNLAARSRRRRSESMDDDPTRSHRRGSPGSERPAMDRRGGLARRLVADGAEDRPEAPLRLALPGVVGSDVRGAAAL